MHHKNKEFEIGDYVMILVFPERYPKNSLRKLNTKATSPSIL